MKLASRHKRRLIPSGIDWTGDVPEGWNTGKVEYYFDIQLGKMLDSNSSSSQDTLEKYYCAANVHFDGGVDSQDLKEMWFSKTEKDAYRIIPGDLLVVEGGAGAGGSAVLKQDVGPVYIQNSIMRVRHGPYTDNQFLCYWIEHVVKSGYMELVCNKATIPHFTKEKLGRVSFPIPPLPEQRAIAAKLDEVCGKIDGLAAKIRKEIEKLEEYRKALITKCVTKGLNKKAKLRPSGIDWIGDVPEGWKVERVKYHYDFITGFTPPTSDESLYPDDGDTWVTIADLKGDVVSESTSHIDHEYALMHLGDMTKAGSLMYSFKLSVGATAIAGKDLFTNEAIASFEPTEGISIPFLKYSSSLIANNAKKNIYNAYLLNRQLIRDAPIVFPSLPEQQEIAAYLDKKCGAIDGVLAKRRKQLEGLAEYRKSVIYSYVTGKKEVAA